MNIATGYLPDSIEYLANLPKFTPSDDKGSVSSDIDWKAYAPPFRHQQATNMCSAFAMTNAISMLDKLENGYTTLFSPLDLFIRSNGQLYGNTVQNTERAAKETVLKEDTCPWTPVTEWGQRNFDNVKEYYNFRTHNQNKAVIETGRPFAISHVTYVIPTRDSMREALRESPLIAVVRVGKGYFDALASNTATGGLHLVVLTHIAKNGCIEAFDSLTIQAGFDGFHWFASDFDILHCFGVVDLPNAYAETRITERYGKDYSEAKENDAKAKIEKAGVQHPTHAAYLVQGFRTYVSAIAYGGYTITDVLNHCTSLRRGEGEIFDFTKIRKEGRLQ